MIENTPPNLPEWMNSTVIGAAWTFICSLLGRVLYHAQLVQGGRRKFWSHELAVELGIALGMGLVADGINEVIGIKGRTAVAVIVAVSYLGPRIIEALFAVATKRAGVEHCLTGDQRGKNKEE